MGTEKTKIHFSLTNEALAIIEQRKEGGAGAWVSKVIIEWDRLLNPPAQDTEECGVQEQILRRVQAVERQNAVILAWVEAQKRGG